MSSLGEAWAGGYEEPRRVRAYIADRILHQPQPTLLSNIRSGGWDVSLGKTLKQNPNPKTQPENDQERYTQDHCRSKFTPNDAIYQKRESRKQDNEPYCVADPAIPTLLPYQFNNQRP